VTRAFFFDDAMREHAVVGVYRQMFAVLGSSAQSVISDPALVDLADTLFTALSARGSCTN
jgi:hypothetical protein